MIITVYKRLLAEAKSSRVKASLIAINDTCEVLSKSVTKDFSIASISRAGGSLGVPKAQSIRNKSGAVYRELIKTWNDEYGNSKKAVSGDDYQWIDRIDDPSLRYLVIELLARNRNLQAELQLCRSVKTLQIDMRENSHINGDVHHGTKLVDTEIEALKNAVQDANLKSCGLRVTERGAVLNASGDTVFTRGFIPALKKIVDSYS